MTLKRSLERKEGSAPTNLDELGLDVFVVQELRENKELLLEELVGEVDGGVGNACAVGSDGVGDVADGDGVEVLVVTRPLDEDLAVN